MSKVSKFMKVRRPMIFAIISQSLFAVPVHSSVSVICQLPLFLLSPLVSSARRAEADYVISISFFNYARVSSGSIAGKSTMLSFDFLDVFQKST